MIVELSPKLATDSEAMQRLSEVIADAAERGQEDVRPLRLVMTDDGITITGDYLDA